MSSYVRPSLIDLLITYKNLFHTYKFMQILDCNFLGVKQM